MSNHSSLVKGLRRLAIFVTAFVLGIFTMIGIQTFMANKGDSGAPPDFSMGSGTVFFVDNTDDCKNHMTEQTLRLYGPLAEKVANNGLVITVPSGGSVWHELELSVLDAQIGAEDASIRNFDHWAADKARTRPERERITGNLLTALRRQEKDDLTVVPAGYTVSLKALRETHMPPPPPDVEKDHPHGPPPPPEAGIN